MMAAPAAKRQRLMQKTKAQEAHGTMPGLKKEATADDKRLVYLVIIPHTMKDQSQEGIQLLAPEILDKEIVSKALLDSCTHPVYERT